MKIISRREQFDVLFPQVPAFRLRQFEEALFDFSVLNFSTVSNMPLSMRERLEESIPFFSLHLMRVFESVRKDTYKAVVELFDKTRVETVLMQNARGQWTVCVSSQVGCAMGCTFCATGSMGLTRNLLADEIIDQYRFWRRFLFERPKLPERISNVVFMGMGEPLANYANVKEAIKQLLIHTDLGPTHITVSTVGLLPMLRKILKDPEWLAVRLAVSLHSAISETRKAMMPSSFDAFLEDLVVWTDEYFAKNESRRQHLTFEYVMLSKINDTREHAEALIRFARRVGKVRINLIPYNFTPLHTRDQSSQSEVKNNELVDKYTTPTLSSSQGVTGRAGNIYCGSLPADFECFETILKDAGVTVTRRRTMGDDIAAACGQLIVEKGTVERKL
jgi:adenine C2-methylase RlmN of 23S rRNA A2503 and tRNA A37